MLLLKVSGLLTGQMTTLLFWRL